MNGMNMYTVKVSEWMISGEIRVYADSAREAIEHVEDVRYVDWNDFKLTEVVEHGWPEVSEVHDWEKQTDLTRDEAFEQEEEE